MTQAVLTDINNGIATVTLNRPDKKNAMSFEMMTQIVEAAENLRHTDKLRAVILTGAGGCFCSGIDVGNLMAAAQNMAGIRTRMLTLRPTPLPMSFKPQPRFGQRWTCL